MAVTGPSLIWKLLFRTERRWIHIVAYRQRSTGGGVAGGAVAQQNIQARDILFKKKKPFHQDRTWNLIGPWSGRNFILYILRFSRQKSMK